MSLQFSDTATYRGIVQIYEREIGVKYGDVSGNTIALKALTADVNLALDDFIKIALTASGTWQFDDSNFTDYPEIKTNLVSGQRDYSFLLDGSSNLILDIFRVMVADTSGIFHEISPVDSETPNSKNDVNTDSFIDGRNQTGVPTRYNKKANGIFLDLIPNYNSILGLKLEINREGSYFAYTDTIKKPGVPGLLHKYFALKPALDYARRKSLANYNQIAAEVLKLEGDENRGIVGDIARHFGRRERDVNKRMTPAYSDCH